MSKAWQISVLVVEKWQWKVRNPLHCHLHLARREKRSSISEAGVGGFLQHTGRFTMSTSSERVLTGE